VLVALSRKADSAAVSAQLDTKASISSVNQLMETQTADINVALATKASVDDITRVCFPSTDFRLRRSDISWACSLIASRSMPSLSVAKFSVFRRSSVLGSFTQTHHSASVVSQDCSLRGRRFDAADLALQRVGREWRAEVSLLQERSDLKADARRVSEELLKKVCRDVLRGDG
jgi:hypothetical protein